jgi:hypothetical protein
VLIPILANDNRKPMIRFVRRVLTLIILFTWAICSTRLVGSAKPLPFSLLFTNPDGSPCDSPCLLGVRPGYTTHQDAMVILQSHPLTRHLRRTTDTHGIDSFVGEYITISLPPDVTWISIVDYRPTFDVTPASAMPRGTLADIILLFGAPDKLGITRSLWCFYTRSQLLVQFGRVSTEHLDPNVPLLQLDIGNVLPATPDPTLKPWQGFSFTSLYRIYLE